MADILDKVIDIAKKLRKTAKKSNDPALQSLITDLNLNLADLKLQLHEERRGTTGAQDADSRTGAPASKDPEPAPTARTLGTTVVSRTPDIGDLRKFPN